MKSKMIFLYTALMVLALGCAKTSSDNIKTSGIYASYSVKGNNQNSVECTAQFQVGGPTGTFMDLSTNDSVTCNGNSMMRSEFAGIITYSATVTYSPGSTYTLVLNRDGESPYTSTAVLPAAIAGINPGSTFTHTKGTALTVSWNAATSSSASMQVTLSFSSSSTSTSYSKNDTAPENGSLGFGSSETDLDVTEMGSYTGTLKYTRSLPGTMSSSLDGVITGTQEVSVPVTLN